MRGRGKGCLTLPGGGTLPTPGQRGMYILEVQVGCLFGHFGVVYGQAADSRAAAGPSRPGGEGGDRADGLSALPMPSYNKSAAFSGDSYLDMGEVGHSFPRDLLVSLEPDETRREPGREGGQ